MISQTKERNVTVSASESAAFGIANNAKIFRILIDGLYADKIQSITREIWSNALDAHVQAGCADRPFSVSFPNPFDPTFRVRDYGISLTHDQVMHMYTSLGHSTKEDTNDAIGKFGIGSKSPFSYTDNFTVTVYKDGTVRFYSAMIGADSVPAIHFMGEQETDEEDGVEVSFPVESSDSRAFQNAAKRVSHGFDVKPLVGNMYEDEFTGWPELPILIQGDGWKLLSGKIEGYSERAYARMGPVLYPINVDALDGITHRQRQILGHTFVIDFAMGDLEITASREELSYGRNDPTKDSILAMVDLLIDSLTEQCIKDFAACESFWDACVKYREQMLSLQLPQAVKDLIKDTAQWNGRKLYSRINIKRSTSAFDMCLLTGAKLKNKVFRYNGIVPRYTDIDAKRKTAILVEDLSEGQSIKRAAARVKRYQGANKQDQILWLRVYNPHRGLQDLFEIFHQFDGVESVMVNDLEDIEPVRTNYGGGVATRRPVQARVLERGKFDHRVELEADDFDAGGVYVRLERNDPVVPAGCSSPWGLFDILRRLGAIDVPVYGAPKSMWKKFEGEQWVDLYDYARAYFDKHDVDFAANAAYRDAVGDVRRDDTLDFINDQVRREDVSKDSYTLVALDLYNRAHACTVADLSSLRALANALSIPVDTIYDEANPMVAELAETLAVLAEVYPMLSILVPSNVEYQHNAVDKVTEYVVMCDNIQNTNQAARAAA